MPAAWKIKELQAALAAAEKAAKEAGGKPPSRRGRDAALLAGGAATGGVGGYALARRSKEKPMVSKALSEKQRVAAYGAALVGSTAGGEVGGRYLGRKRYEQGRHPQDGFFQGPAVNRGYFKAKRTKEGSSLKGGMIESTAVRKGLADVGKAFAARDENSSVGTKISWAGPTGPHRRPTLNARSGVMAGKSRGVGRKAGSAKDENSSPAVTWVQPRRPDGKFVSHENDLKIYKPEGGRSKMPRQSTLMRYGKGKDAASKPFVSKSDDQRFLTVTSPTGLDYGAASKRGRRVR